MKSPRCPLFALAVLLFILGLLVSLSNETANASPAQSFTVRQECSNDGKISAHFSWTSSASGQQWIDLTLFDNGFAPGTFLGVGPLTSSVSSFRWDGLLASRLHLARVNTLDANGWAASNTLSFQTFSCSGSSDGAASPGMESLRGQIQQQVAASGLTAAVAITDLQTGETISVNGDVSHLTACTINFFVLLQVVRDLAAGLYPESMAGSLISSTVYSSNPVTARDLLFISGGGDLGAAITRVNELMKAMGTKASFYDHPPAYPEESIYGSNNYFTANDFNRALFAFWQGQVTSIPWRDYLLDKMTGVKPGLQYLIPAGVGDGVTSHKNGFVVVPSGWVDNDAGIVTFERGGSTYAYAVSFFTQDVPVKYADIPLGQTVSSLAWQYFSSRYP